MSRDYKHQCRYCAYCIVTIDDFPICENDKVKNKERGDALPYDFKRPNRCPHFNFNEIAADYWGDETKVYRPRKRSPFTQEKLFDFPTDKQRSKAK